jgi:hypothetical protein
MYENEESEMTTGKLKAVMSVRGFLRNPKSASSTPNFREPTFLYTIHYDFFLASPIG